MMVFHFWQPAVVGIGWRIVFIDIANKILSKNSATEAVLSSKHVAHITVVLCSGTIL